MPLRTNKVDPEVARFWLSQLTQGDASLRAYAASELHRLKSRTRPTAEPRGTLHRAAGRTGDLGAEVQAALIAALHDDDHDVRREAAAALAQWGDATAVDPLSRLAAGHEQDPEESVRRACLRALTDIGGRGAARSLSASLTDPSPDVRLVALNGVCALGRRTYASSEMRGVARRVAGRAAAAASAADATMISALQDAQNNDSNPYLRSLAAAALDAIA